MVNTDTKTHYGYLEQKGDFDFARAAWIADYKDPESFLGISRKASGNNYSRYNKPEFEELMDKAAAAGGNPAERFKLLSEAETVLVDDTGNMPLLYYSYHDHRFAEAEGLGGQRDGRPSLALRQQGIEARAARGPRRFRAAIGAGTRASDGAPLRHQAASSRRSRRSS